VVCGVVCGVCESSKCLMVGMCGAWPVVWCVVCGVCESSKCLVGVYGVW
jgi:hypothetical protein